MSAFQLLFVSCILAVTHVAATSLSAASGEFATEKTTTTTLNEQQHPLHHPKWADKFQDVVPRIDLAKIQGSSVQVIDTRPNYPQELAASSPSDSGERGRPIRETEMGVYQPDSIEAKVSDATTQFGINFLNSLSKNASENVVLSPVSLQILLNMILLGSGDNSTTQKELLQVLGYEKTGLLESNRLTEDRLKPHQAIKNILDSISSATRSEAAKNCHKTNDSSSTGQPNFNIASQVLTNEQMFTLKEEYKRDLEKFYLVSFDNFSDDKNKAEPLHERVNKFVRINTQNQIEKAVSEDDLSNPLLIMVLLNAAYFKGRWLNAFHPESSSDETFLNNGDVEKQVKFMRQTGDFEYADFTTKQFELAPASNIHSLDSDIILPSPTNETAETASQYPRMELSKEELRRLELSKKLNCTVLSMAFSLNEGQELNMVILLPAKSDGIEELQKGLDTKILSEIYRSLEHQEVRVEIPKFSFEASLDAKSTLSKMGLTNIFNSPNFDRMMNLKTGSTEVNKIIHKAKINVDETGAEAAAASMASIVLRNFVRQPTPAFIADHPFLFIIRHSRSNMPLFMGRVNQL